MNPKSKDNLKPFVKGHDPRRNIKGQPPKLPELELLMAEGVSKEDLLSIIKAVRQKATKGDTRAADFIFDRGYGKPKQSTDLKISSIPTIVFQNDEGDEIENPFKK